MEIDASPCEQSSLVDLQADFRPDASQLDACKADMPCDDECCPPVLTLVPKAADDAPC